MNFNVKYAKGESVGRGSGSVFFFFLQIESLNIPLDDSRTDLRLLGGRQGQRDGTTPYTIESFSLRGSTDVYINAKKYIGELGVDRESERGSFDNNLCPGIW